MGIENEDLGEGTVGERLARAEQLVETAERQRDALKEAGATLYEMAEYERQIEELKRNQLEAELNLAKEVEKSLKTRVKQLEILTATGEATEAELQAAKDLLELKKQQNIEAQAELDTAERRAAIQKKLEDGAESFITRMTGLQEYTPGKDFASDLLMNPEGTIGAAAKKFKLLATPVNIATSLFSKVKETTIALAFEQDQAVVNFRRATGAGSEFDGTIRGLERSLFTAGVSAAEAGQSVQTLFLNVSDFTNMSGPQQEELAKTTAVLNELGVAADNTAKNIEFATRALGMSTSQAEELQRELFTFAQDLGVSADKIAQDFQKFGPQIAALGSKGVDAFKQLEMQAKATGLQIDELVNITEQFNKFDTAAQAVGKLNAMLGGPFLNSLQMVNETNPAKRMELLKGAIDKAGLSFNTMDFYQRKAIASSMGLNEQQLALVMRGNFNVGPVPKTAEEIEELEKQTAQFNTVMEELTQTAKMLAISFGPLIGGVKLLFQVFQELAPVMPYLGAAAVALAIKFEILGKAQLKAFAPLGAAYLAYEAMVHILGLSEEKAAAAAIIIGGALTFAMYSLGSGVTFATGGLNLIVAALSAIAIGVVVGFSPSVLFAIGALTIAFFAMAPAVLALMPVLLPLIGVLGLIAVAAVGLAFAFNAMFGEGVVNNLQLMAVEIASIVASINELSATKAVAFTATMAATTTAAAATALTGGALAAAVAAPAAGPAAGPATAAAAPKGPPPTININLSIDGNEFATVVNSVEVSKYGGGSRSSMYDSIVDIIEQGLVKG